MKDKKLTLKQETFVLAYLETGNASEAYRRAFNTQNMLPTTINNRAYVLLRDDKIRARVETAREQSFNRATIDRAGVLALITEIATASAADLMEVNVRCCRHCWGVNFAYQWKNDAEFGYKVAEALDVTAREHRQWEKDVALGARRPEPEPQPVPTDEGGYGFDVFAKPNPDCPRCLGEGHTTTRLKDTRELKGAARRLYAGVKQTREGIEVKTRDQDKMIALLAKEFGIAKDVAPTINVGVGVNAQGAENVTVVSVDPQEAARQYQELMKS